MMAKKAEIVGTALPARQQNCSVPGQVDVSKVSSGPLTVSLNGRNIPGSKLKLENPKTVSRLSHKMQILENRSNSARATSCPRLDESQNAEKVQLKRNQWKAASARYYERHPEVKEQKRLKMVAARAAKKQARRRWDPPRQVRSRPPAPDTMDEDEDFDLDDERPEPSAEEQLRIARRAKMEEYAKCKNQPVDHDSSSADAHMAPENAAAQSLLSLSRVAVPAPVAPQNSHESGIAGTWAALAPDYSSRQTKEPRYSDDLMPNSRHADEKAGEENPAIELEARLDPLFDHLRLPHFAITGLTADKDNPPSTATVGDTSVLSFDLSGRAGNCTNPDICDDRN
ncbi:hypothetical protein B0H14DRAFT_2598830 [Mycena olivaceomarginata]|nr:hypothetical protein B0H14DRAFT_2598830 [Mycena olivaceomarginata]